MIPLSYMEYTCTSDSIHILVYHDLHECWFLLTISDLSLLVSWFARTLPVVWWIFPVMNMKKSCQVRSSPHRNTFLSIFAILPLYQLTCTNTVKNIKARHVVMNMSFVFFWKSPCSNKSTREKATAPRKPP